MAGYSVSQPEKQVAKRAAAAGKQWLSTKYPYSADQLATIAPMANSKSIRLRVLQGETIAFGPGKAALLLAIQQSGSISAAARAIGMSYRRAWLLVEAMNQCFRQPLVATATGGAKGGGAQVTALGQEVLVRYQAMQQRAEAAVAADMAYFAGLMSVPGSAAEPRS
ncbi:bacterial regulatory helix-turn-helix, lysR family protein [Collimonas pratensis]|uniref:Bacterial regulatory helix-turn-helix, lysR family protein n=1 Tax=Collimonas pratensis TaxID=279113 RepID=A0A127Q2Z8_9BURK|nr:bacterial regulatory helix-turn-helix, lysR family protein [Collimonas pratensis]